MIRRTAVLCAAVAAAVALAACGEKSEPSGSAAQVKRLTLMLDYFPNADHAGIYEAQADGEFRRAALDVRIETPSDPSAPLKLLAAGKVDLAVSYEPEVLLARDRGAKVVSIGALVQRPLTSVIAVGKKLRSAADLAGRTVGTAGIPYQSAYLKTIVAESKAHEPAKEVNVGFDLVPAMLSHKVYATLGAFWNYEGVQLAREHRHPSILRIDRLGVPTYDELVIVARTNEVRERGALLRRFMQALARGHRSLREDPAKGIDALLKANRDLDKGLQKAAVKATMSSFFPSDTTKPFGWQSPSAWAAYTRWMARNRLIRLPANPTAALTNEYLPGQGV
ncbi:MAG TPA: ABC transporter substrate-binding protein [Solirubrobacteraceae bacterium]|nr:ABC transporter substrate-binding protein [Solirubrobacteraceae bacterium]